MKKKYIPPKLGIKKIKLNLFFKSTRSKFGNTEGVLLASCTCIDGCETYGPCTLGCGGPC